MEYSKLKEELHQLVDQVNDEAALEASLAESEKGNGISPEEGMSLINARFGKR